MKWDYMTDRQRGEWIRQHDRRYPVRLRELFNVDADTLELIFAGADYPSESGVCVVDISRAPILASLLTESMKAKAG